jgi:exopolysaccharide biosynthesis WecB/TagA/CpsF family protein
MPITLTIDDYDVPSFSTILRQRLDDEFRYIVTPNVDHLIRYHDDPNFRRLYAAASYVLLDSRFLARLLSLFKRQGPIRVCTGSDLTVEIFTHLIRPSDRIVLVGATASQAMALRRTFRLEALHHIEPPMGFITDTAAVEACLRDIEAASPFRFCFLALGSPRQEMLAYQLKARGRARGLGLCIGASINFLTGAERRAPPWMQRLSLEWLFRLLRNPRRLAYRYLIRGPRAFWLLPKVDIEYRVRAPVTGACGPIA